MGVRLPESHIAIPRFEDLFGYGCRSYVLSSRSNSLPTLVPAPAPDEPISCRAASAFFGTVNGDPYVDGHSYPVEELTEAHFPVNWR